MVMIGMGNSGADGGKGGGNIEGADAGMIMGINIGVKKTWAEGYKRERKLMLVLLKQFSLFYTQVFGQDKG